MQNIKKLILIALFVVGSVGTGLGAENDNKTVVSEQERNAIIQRVNEKSTGVKKKYYGSMGDITEKLGLADFSYKKNEDKLEWWDGQKLVEIVIEKPQPVAGVFERNLITFGAFALVIAELAWYFKSGRGDADDVTFSEQLEGFIKMAKPSDWKMLVAMVAQVGAGALIDYKMRESVKKKQAEKLLDQIDSSPQQLL